MSNNYKKRDKEYRARVIRENKAHQMNEYRHYLHKQVLRCMYYLGRIRYHYRKKLQHIPEELLFDLRLLVIEYFAE